jgi:L-ascorbate metabolism protein UlaG (beta-lactamase superfamily)
MKIQFLGQNCFLFTYKDKTILSDPFYNYKKAESGFDITAQKIDYILLTHAHGDHIADVQLLGFRKFVDTSKLQKTKMM